MFNTLYTNTSNAKGIIGLLTVTFATSVIANYTPEIVDGIKSITTKGKELGGQIRHRGKKQYSVCTRLNNGNIIDTGDRIWR